MRAQQTRKIEREIGQLGFVVIHLRNAQHDGD
jgi:hypothetical protein